MQEDMVSLFFDADNDGDADLLVTNGDIQMDDPSTSLKPRLFINDGKGRLHLQPDAIPDEVVIAAGAAVVADYDGDGDLDIFIGGRVSKKYPIPPRSYLLQNNGGVFSDITAEVCPALQNAGMVTGAIWADIDNDKKVELVVTGEWMPVRFFKNENRKLVEITTTTGLAEMDGMWRSLIAADVDNDGDIDLVAGNLGLNNAYRVSSDYPMHLYATDLDNNGSIDPLLFYFIKGEDGQKYSYPAISRNLFADQVPAIKKQFLLYKDYAKARFQDIFKNKPTKDTYTLTCNETRSCWLENMGKGKFTKHPLPVEAQFAPVNAIVCNDIDGDGINDLVLAGNEYQAEVVGGRYDASYGTFLKGDRKKSFKAMPPVASGFVIKGDVKDMKLIQLVNGKKILLAGVNNDALRLFSIQPKTARP